MTRTEDYKEKLESMSKEENGLTDEEVVKEKSKEWAIRDKYCIRIQNAFKNMGCGCDCEDIPSILVEFEKVIKNEQKDEIERMTEERNEYKRLYETMYRKWSNLSDKEINCDALRKEKNEYFDKAVELQKKVDELMVKVKSLECTDMFKEAYIAQLKEENQQAVKDMAKKYHNIMEQEFMKSNNSNFYEFWCNFNNDVAKQFGVEVE